MGKTKGKSDNKTKNEMLKELQIPEEKWDYFSNTATKIMYDRCKHSNNIEMTTKNRFLYFLNEILEELDIDLINEPIEFKLERTSIRKLDGEKYIQEKRETLESYGINVNKDLLYNNRKRTKLYGLTVLKGICRFYGYELKTNSYIKNKKTIRFYELKKVEDEQDK